MNANRIDFVRNVRVAIGYRQQNSNIMIKYNFPNCILFYQLGQ